MRYLAQCPAGLQAVAAAALESDLAGAETVALEDGLVLFETQAGPGRLGPLPYLANVFAVIRQAERPARDLDGLLGRLARRPDLLAGARRLVAPGEQSFRVVLSDAGRLVPGGRQLAPLIDGLARASGLRHRSREADVEFWLIRRRSGLAVLARRLGRRAKTEKNLERGELRPELAHLLCRLSEPAADDVFLDPCAGSGAIAFARATSPYDMIYALDADADAVRRLKGLIKRGAGIRRRKGSPVIAAVADATRLARFEDGFVAKVVTDPPWGLYDPGLGDPARFTRALLAELVRVTRPGGILVLLLGDRALAGRLQGEFAAALSPAGRYDILVNGKPAAVLKWRRTDAAPARTGAPA